jgi:hypothetical protein
MDTYLMASEILNQKSLYLSPTPTASGSADGTMNDFLENYHDESVEAR